MPDPQLPEKKFIQEGFNKNPWPVWLWLFLLTVVVAIFWGIGNWYTGQLNLLFVEDPFLQVTNRQMSLFLWQNPEYMRVNAKEKSSYLTGFNYLESVTLNLAAADQYVAAPPALMFLYHTWHRLVSKEFSETPMPQNEFLDFLTAVPEWRPRYWPAAPQKYVQLVDSLPKKNVEDLSVLPIEELPLEVRMAFQGWMNYFKEGEAINKMVVTEKQMSDFLHTHPHYARNYWRNIVADTTPNYLKSFMTMKKATDAPLPADEMAPFLRVAVFNYLAPQ